MLILDTNIVSLLVRSSESVLVQYDNALDRGETLGISAITHYELKRGAFDPRFARKKVTLESFLENLELVIPGFHTYEVVAEIW